MKTSAPTAKNSGVTLKSANSYFKDIPAKQRKIATELRRIVTESAPQAVEALKWNIPWYDDHGLMCYICAYPAYVTLGFAHGADLNAPHGLLEGTGKGMRHVKVHSLDELRDIEKSLKAMIRQGVKLNRASKNQRE
jgi:hypothetical protein